LILRPSVPRNKRATTRAEVYSLGEIAAILAAAPAGRDRAFLTVVYACGLRLDQAGHLQTGDLDAARGQLRVRRGKGAKERVCRIRRRLTRVYRDYWRMDRRHRPGYFPSPDGARNAWFFECILPIGLKGFGGAACLAQSAYRSKSINSLAYVALLNQITEMAPENDRERRFSRRLHLVFYLLLGALDALLWAYLTGPSNAHPTGPLQGLSTTGGLFLWGAGVLYAVVFAIIAEGIWAITSLRYLDSERNNGSVTSSDTAFLLLAIIFNLICIFGGYFMRAQ